MTRQDYTSKQAELDRQLNDPDMAMEPGKIWALLEEIAGFARKEQNYPLATGRSSEPQAGTPGCLPAR